MSGFSFSQEIFTEYLYAPGAFQIQEQNRDSYEVFHILVRRDKKQIDKPMLGVDQVQRKYIHQVKQKGKPWCVCRDGGNFYVDSERVSVSFLLLL